MNTSYKISIIIPLYNTTNCICSLLCMLSHDLPKEVELLFVDDGSTDNSIDILKEWMHKHESHLIRLSKNKGAGAARNVGIINSNGEYIFFLDADDEFSGYENLLRLYNLADEKNFDIIGGNLAIRKTNGIVTALDNRFDFDDQKVIHFNEYQNDYGFTRFLYKRSFLLSNGLFFPEIFCYEDPCFLVKCLHETDAIFFDNTVSYIINEHPNRGIFENHIRDLEYGFQHNLDFSLQHGYQNLYRMNILRVFEDFGDLWFLTGRDKGEFIQSIINKHLIQEIILDKKYFKTILPQDTDEYFGVEDECKLIDGGLKIPKGTGIDFCSFINSISFYKWERYSVELSPALVIEMKGDFEVYVYNTDFNGNKILAIKKRLSSRTKRFYVMDCSEIQDSAFLTIDVKSFDNDTIMYSGYLLNTFPELNRNITPALCFTTFHREKYVEDNLHRILELNDDRIFTYIIDNGNSLELPENEHYKVIPNKNTGGSGGFARGMMEIAKDFPEKGFTHFVLMDDDIDLYPSVLERLITFLSHLKDEYKDSFIGGSMLRRDMDYFVVETGAKRDGLSVKGNGFGLDIRDPKDCLINDSFDDAEYNAWWFCCIPVSYLRDDNYPLPIFFQWDDVDYGIRNKARVITMNGICVWHDCFDSKRSAQMIYYSSRNPMIVDACHEGRMTKRKYLKHFRNIIRDQIYMYRYHEAEAILRGVEDFLKGPDWLINLKQDEYNREIMKLNVPLQSCDVDMDRYFLCIGIEDCDLLHKLVRLLTLNGMLLKANRKIIIPLYAWRPVQTYRATEVIYYDELTKRGYTAKKDLKKAFECYKKYRKLRRRVAREYDKVGALYKERYPYMTSKECWEKILFNT